MLLLGLATVPFVSPLVSSIVPQGIAAGTGLMLSAQDANEMGSVGITELPRTPVQQNYLNIMQSNGIGSGDIEGVSNPQETLYHYTNEKGMNGIVESEQLNPSLKANNPKRCKIWKWSIFI